VALEPSGNNESSRNCSIIPASRFNPPFLRLPAQFPEINNCYQIESLQAKNGLARRGLAAWDCSPPRRALYLSGLLPDTESLTITSGIETPCSF
jgi:hypothetical protein